MYSVHGYGKMIADIHRMNAYVSALKQSVKPGSVVVDLGSGPGFFALLSCKLGAGRVYAIEPDGVIQIASDCAKQNGVSDRIVFIQAESTNVTLPERADVIVADLRGVLPFFQKNLPSMQDACNRFLASGGVLIPRSDQLWAALIEAPVHYENLDAPWRTQQGVSLAAARNVAMNSWFKRRIAASDLLCEPIAWHTVKYLQIADFDACSEMSFTITQKGTAHGIAIWFDSELCEGISLSNAPDKDELIYGNAFFPLLQPVEVNVGDNVELRLRADLIKDDYVWSWETRFYDQTSPASLKAHFKQSTLLGTPLSPVQLKRRADSYTPLPSDEALIDSFIVSRMDGATSLEQLAQEVSNEFPQLFPAPKDALDVVADVSVKFSK
jgi:protein arginine N-methyltransferase 1